MRLIKILINVKHYYSLYFDKVKAGFLNLATVVADRHAPRV